MCRKPTVMTAKQDVHGGGECRLTEALSAGRIEFYIRGVAVNTLLVMSSLRVIPQGVSPMIARYVRHFGPTPMTLTISTTPSDTR